MTAASGIPTKYQFYWAQGAGGAFVRMPPFASSPTPGFASFNDGFPPTNMTLGGINPYGQDMNGILRSLSQWSQWQQLGGPVPYDATFQTQQGGYPVGALIASATTVGLFWLSTTDNNITNPDSGGAGWTRTQAALLPMTGAQLQYTNATTLTLAPRGSGFLWVNGLNYPVTAGLTVSNGGLSASTLYYIYAKVTAGALAIDTPSTTGYTLGSNGIPVKSGDATRTLVGMVSTNGSSQFANADGSRLVASYFQRQLVRSRTQFSTNRTTTSSVFAELNSEIRNQFVSWASENVQFAVAGSFACSGSAGAATQVGFNSTSVGEQEASALNSGGGGGNVTGPCGISGTKVGLAEGLNYATVLSASNGGTATWHGANTAITAQVTMTVTLYQ